MSVSWQIPRNCLAWVLISQFALIIPHIERLPWWVLVAYGFCAFWRVMIYQGRWSFPPKIVKVVLACLCFWGIFRSYGTMIGMEPTVALLLSGFCLKLLEVAEKRDVYVIIFLAYFVATTQFLFEQEFLMTLFVYATVLLITTSLIALHQHSYDKFEFNSLKKATIIFLQAIPLMALIFLVFPRFEPLWKVPLPSHQAKTGISDTLSPGDISNLSQSSALAFRVVFESDIPLRENLYWRGLVMSEFDGRTWTQGRLQKNLLKLEQTDDILLRLNNPAKYTVYQEATHQPWLFSLALAYSAEPEIHTVSDFRLVRTEDIHSRIKYSVSSDQNAEFGLSISDRTRRLETSLPPVGNNRAKEFARALYFDAMNDQDFIEKILNKFRQENYVYTLKPPLLGDDSVDEFLFETRRGFCSHYASAFVYLMRSVGIPARVVAGYQGGEINPITGTVLVHQFDAHGWAEVWLEGQGWVRFDPTGAVSPDRIEYGLEDAMEEEGSFLSEAPLSPLRYRNVAWLNQMRLQMDAFSYYWSSWVLQYKGDRQLRVLQNLLGEVTPWRVALFLLLIGSTVMALVAIQLLRGTRAPRSPAYVRRYLFMCAQLEKAGYKREAEEGAISFARRVVEENPPWKQHLLSATRTFVTLSYEPVSQQQRDALLKQLRRDVYKLIYILRVKRTDR